MDLFKAINRGWKRRRSPVVFPDSTRTAPVSRVFGLDRGQAIDRHYIEAFLDEYRQLIHGRVLEVAEDTYSSRFGGGPVTAIDVLNPSRPDMPGGVYLDLSHNDGVPENLYDCFVCTQTLNVIFDMRSVIANAEKMLKPGGHLLITVPGISQISRYDMDRWGDYWRFTTLSLQRLLEQAFTGEVRVCSYGNALSAMAFLQGLAVEDLPEQELLGRHDPDYQVIVAAVATKKG